MNERDRIKNNISYNEKWLSRDLDEVNNQKRRLSRACSSKFNGKSPELKLAGDEITWKRFTKHG